MPNNALEDHLVVIDMQTAFLASIKKYQPQTLENALQVIKALIGEFRNASWPITALVFNPQINGTLLPSLWKDFHLSEIQQKYSVDAFRTGTFKYTVKPHQTLHLVGCYLEACVADTARSAVEKGHHVVIYENAILSNKLKAPFADGVQRLLRHPNIEVKRYAK